VVIRAGAKVPGTISVSDDNRIGSTAVVVQSIPANSKVIGIPGQNVQRSHKHSVCEAPDFNHSSLPEINGISLKQLLVHEDDLEVEVNVSSQHKTHVHTPDDDTWDEEDFSIQFFIL
jgi:serine O-acetyltransferase